MDGLRILAHDHVVTPQPCSRCQASGHSWDQIMGQPFCPDCEELLVKGEAPPLIERVEPNRCSVCDRVGTLRYLTFPLESPTPLEIDLCSQHIRALLARCLPPHAFHQLRRKLRSRALEAEQIFLLHSAFYDSHGRALRPAVVGEE